MSNAFNVGDIVELKSGGPEMTVVEVARKFDDRIQCTWFAGKKNESGWFPPAALTHATEEPESE